MTGIHAALGQGQARGFQPQHALPSGYPDLERILRLVQGVVPGLCGEQGAGAMLSEEEQAARMSIALVEHWRLAAREAGPHYTVLRCWGLAMWQPVYLSVIAVHLDTHVPKLAGIVQPVVHGFPQKFYLPSHAPAAGSLLQRMRHATDELRLFSLTMRSALMPRVGLHDSAADRVLAECVFGALLLVRRHDPAMTNPQVVTLGEEWLTQLGIAGTCNFFAYRARDGTATLALDRQVCCHHFRRHDGEKCSTCPKLSLDTRIARLLADQS